MGFFDGAFSPQNFQTGILPNWLTEQLQSIPPQKLVEGFKMLTGQQDNAALPPNASTAALSAPMPQYSRNLWTPPDSNEDSPPLGSPFGPPITQGMQPMGAPMPPQQQSSGMSAMAQAPLPQSQPQQGQAIPGTGGGIKDFLLGTLTGGPLGGVNALAAHGQKQEMYNALVSQGVEPQKAWFIVNAPKQGELAGIVSKGTSDIQEFEYAKKNDGFTGTFEQWMQRKRAGAGEYGMQPVYGTRVNPQTGKTETVIMQLGKSGDMIESKKPEGVEFSPGIEKVDLGTEWGLYDKRAGVIVGRVPKDVVGAARGKEIGEGQGQATNMLPAVDTTVQNAIKTINELRQHPGLEVGTGLSSKIDPRSWIPGQPGYDFLAKNKQAQGQAFMGAREALKGAGQVTDFEGAKGEQAIANLDAAQSKEQYLAALDNLEQMMKASYANLRTKAGLSSGVTQPAPANNLRSKYGLE